MTDLVNCCDSDTDSHHPVEYWISEAEIWKARYESARVELDEFTASSRELEHELEEELNQYKQLNSRLRSDLQTLTEENRILKDSDMRNSKRIIAIEDQIKTYATQNQSLLQQRRELEQKNDDMETSQRNITASLSEHSRRVEELVEAKALLESELEETRNQKEIEQRLRDELRDLQDELNARRKSDEENQSNRHEQRRRPHDESPVNPANSEIKRLQLLASGRFEKPASHKLSRNFEVTCLKDSKARPVDKNNRIIHSLVRKISTLETKLLTMHSQPAQTLEGKDPRR